VGIASYYWLNLKQRYISASGLAKNYGNRHGMLCTECPCVP
jgi:hypothetical protein